MSTKQLAIFVGLLLIIITGSCDDALNSCKDQSKRSFNISYYKVYYAKVKPVYKKSVKDTLIQHIKVYGIERENGDSLLYDTTALFNSSKLDLPLSQLADKLSFVIQLNKDKADTFSIFYKRSRTFSSYKCGYYTDYTIDSIRPIEILSKIDSVRISHPTISNEKLENCKIYFRTDTSVHR